MSASAWAAETETLHVVKSSVNADSDKAEFCLEFDQALAPTPPARLAASLRLEADGTPIIPQNIDVAASSLCLFPLDRDKSYRLSIANLRGANDQKLAVPYNASFTIPDRSPSLAFTGRNGVEGFGSYDDPLSLRAVNIAHAKLTIYRVTDPVVMARAWQDRGQVSLAPSESAYLARNKGKQIWEQDNSLEAPPNVTLNRKIVLHDLLPNLDPGLYLIVADSNSETSKPEDNKSDSKGLAPLAATWFTKSDFSLQALRDDDGVHVFAAATMPLGAKGGLHLAAMSRKPEQLAEAQGGADGVGLIPYPPNLADKNDMATLIGTDAAGNVAFADIQTLPILSNLPALGTIVAADPLAIPGAPVTLSFSLTSPENTPSLTSSSLLHLAHGDSLYTRFVVPPLTNGSAKLSFAAPASQGVWSLRWRKEDGTALSDTPLRVTSNLDAPYLVLASDRDILGGETPWTVTVKSLSSTGKPVPLVNGQLMLGWQKLDPAMAGWKDYIFGIADDGLKSPTPIADFLTDFEGTTELHLTLPARPQEPGLYQAVLSTVTESDAGIANAPPVILPLRPDSTVIGIKPLAADARFPQNGIARFALIGFSSDSKPRDLSDLSYQLYEEGRSFAWYQDEGRWKYKPEPQLRPIGGGAVAVKADGSSVLEIPVAAGNYRLEILDGSGKKLAQAPFSAGWDSNASSDAPAALSVSLPKILQPGLPALAHVLLPQPAMLTAIVADTRIRKIIHEMRPKGDNAVTFTPGADWQSGVSLNITAHPQKGDEPLYGETEAAIALPHTTTLAPALGEAALVAGDNPEGLILRAGSEAATTLGIENQSAEKEIYHYSLTSSPGLKIDGSDKGDFTLGGRQSRSLSFPLSGEEPGIKEIKLDITGTHTPHLSRVWHVAVLAKDNFLYSGETVAVAPQQALISNAAKPRGLNDASIAFIARRPMDGLGELLVQAFTIHPFTTKELAISLQALQLWGDTIAAAEIAPASLIEARRQQWLQQLLRHQNPDGGFAALRGGDSTMDDTSAALTALGTGAGKNPLADPARDLAIGWINQRLANTWFDEKERAARAGAYAALAAADAIDPASLHYFSDTSANTELPAIAEANIAAAFKHIRDPNAAAFWIKKMLDANGEPKTIPLLGALAATDALSSDDVHQAMHDMVDTLRKGLAPGMMNIATLLRAIAADNADAGDWRVTSGGQSHGVAGVMAVHLPDSTAASLHNGDTQPLFVTFAAETDRPPSEQPSGGSVARHIYRLNGVELSPHIHPSHNETYIVELKGTLPITQEGEQVVLHESAASALRPIGCPLSPHIDVPAFIPWFTPDNLTPVQNCEMLPHELNVVLPESPNGNFNIVYFAHIDVKSETDLPPPRLRVLK